MFMYSASIIGKQFDTVYGLYLPFYSIPSPEVQADYKEIPGRDGALDKTEKYGVVRFKDREWSLTFNKTSKTTSQSDILELERQLLNDIHGKRGNIIFDDDTSYHWVGRVSVVSVSCEQNGLIIVELSMVTEPYKYTNTNVSVTKNLSSTATTITLTNGRKPVVPDITVSDSATISFTINGTTYTKTLSAGTTKVVNLVLYEGNTVITATGTGTIKFEYVGAHL